MAQISNTCVCGVTTITRHYKNYGITRWAVEDVHTIREQMGLSEWEAHEAEAFLEGHDDSISEVQTSTGWEWITDLLIDGERRLK